MRNNVDFLFGIPFLFPNQFRNRIGGSGIAISSYKVPISQWQCLPITVLGKTYRKFPKNKFLYASQPILIITSVGIYEKYTV